MSLPRLLTVAQVADALQLHERTVKDTLWLFFGDIDPKRHRDWSGDKPWNRPIVRWQAHAIVGFWRYWRTRVPRIVVHCDAGWSRSQGVAAALCALEGWREEDHFDRCTPNAFVKSMVRRAARRSTGPRTG